MDDEDRIFNELAGKAACVYEKLQNQNGDLFKETIGKFINNPKFDLILQSGGECSTGDEACTSPKELNNGKITIKIINEGRGGLELAATILHEGIHAEIYKYVDEHKKGIDPQNRPNLLGYYFEYKANNGSNLATSNAQHQHMADKYVKPIAEAIRALDNYKYPLDDYMAFGWDGLRKYGWDGYWDNGEYIKLDKNQYEAIKENVVNSSSFGCN